MYQIAIDPGITGTGWCVFVDGKPHSSGTIKPKGPTRTDKLTSLSNELRIFYCGLVDELGCYPSEVTLEEWQKHIPRFKLHSMLLCAESRGVIMAVTWEFTDKIKYLNKGTAKKEEADILAKQIGRASCRERV